jgi:hypothetical protein
VDTRWTLRHVGEDAVILGEELGRSWLVLWTNQAASGRADPEWEKMKRRNNKKQCRNEVRKELHTINKQYVLRTKS